MNRVKRFILAFKKSKAKAKNSKSRHSWVKERKDRLFDISECVCDLEDVPCSHRRVHCKRVDCDVQHVLCTCERKVPPEYRHALKDQRLMVTDIGKPHQIHNVYYTIKLVSYCLNINCLMNYLS